MTEIDMGKVYKRLWDNDIKTLSKGMPEQTFEKFSAMLTSADAIIKDTENDETALRRVRIYFARSEGKDELPFVFVLNHLSLLGMDSFFPSSFVPASDLSKWRLGEALPPPDVRGWLFAAVRKEWELSLVTKAA